MLKLLWQWSLLATFPAVMVLASLSINTWTLYRDVGLDQIGHRGLTPLTLHKAGEIEFDFLTRKLWIPAVDTELPHLALFVSEQDLDRLDQDIPASGFEYVPAMVLHGGDTYKAQVRYRGDYHIHWSFHKKSFRIKTKRQRLLMGMRHINLVVPKTQALLNNYMSYRVAQELDLLTPEFDLVTVSLNGEYQGIYLLVEQINEVFLRRNNRLPGDIYSGDQIFGEDKWNGLGDQLFEQPGLWDKVAVNNKFPEDSRSPLIHLLSVLDMPSGTERNDRLNRLVDIPAFARFNAMETLLSTAHHDQRHNWKLYFDPIVGRFVPIVWDSYGWNPNYLYGGKSSLWNDADTPPSDVISSRLMVVLNGSEAFRQYRQDALDAFFQSGKDELLLSEFDALALRIRQLVQYERLAVDTNNERVTESAHRVAVSSMRDVMERIFAYHRSNAKRVSTKDPFQERQSQVWSGTLRLNGEREISDDVSVAPGTVIEMAENSHITFTGKLNLGGTADAPIVVKAKAGHWGTITLQGQGASGSRLSHFSFSGGTLNSDGHTLTSGMLSLYEVSDVLIEDCHVFSNQEGDDMVHVVYSDVTIRNCQFDDANMDAVDLDLSTATITGSSFTGSGNDGLDLMGSNVRVLDSTFVGNGDKGISVGEGSRLYADRNTFEENAIGVEVKEASVAEVENSEFVENDLAVNLMKKNWQYGAGGSLRLCDNRFHRNLRRDTVDKHSRLTESCQ